MAVYTHRFDAPRVVWEQFFGEAEQEIGVLVYAGLFLVEDDGLQRILARKAKDGVQIRILLGDPDSPSVSERGAAEGIDDMIVAKVRNAITWYRPLLRVEGAAPLA